MARDVGLGFEALRRGRSALKSESKLWQLWQVGVAVQTGRHKPGCAKWGAFEIYYELGDLLDKGPERRHCNAMVANKPLDESIGHGTRISAHAPPPECQNLNADTAVPVRV